MTSSRARLSDCLKILRSLRSGRWTVKTLVYLMKKVFLECGFLELLLLHFCRSFRSARRVSLAPTLVAFRRTCALQTDNNSTLRPVDTFCLLKSEDEEQKKKD